MSVGTGSDTYAPDGCPKKSYGGRRGPSGDFRSGEDRQEPRSLMKPGESVYGERSR